MKKLLFILVAGITTLSALFGNAATRSDKAEISRNLDIFNSIYKELQMYYVDTIDARKSIETAINAMLADIDPYTEYIPVEDQEDFMTMSTGEYAGIGSYIMQRDGKVYFSEPREGSPAQHVGIRPGDLIMKIDNDTVLGWTSEKVSERLRGQAGTNVSVTVKRPYVNDSILTFNINREIIQIDPVPYYGVIKDNIGYIDITTFNEKTASEVKDAFIDLKNNHQITSLMLDLRNNGGGLLEEAVKILGMFLPKNTEVLRTRGKSQLNEKVYKTTSRPLDAEIPIVVLVNDNTASASEILAGALQDLDRAVIVGRRSFGKGLVQSVRPLPYEGMLKVTISKYYIPSGRLIQAIDYSHRNPDGSVGRMPDSLTTEYPTANGRIVRDGGGITPDSTVTLKDISVLTYALVVDNWVFDYANRFAATTPSIAAPRDFEITDSIYTDFSQFVDPEKFEYDKLCEKRLSDLREVVEATGYMTDSVVAQLDILEALLKQDLKRDLDTHRDEVSRYLVSEIVRRYYYDSGVIENNLNHDEDIAMGSAILLDPKQYAAILSPTKEDK